MPPPTRAGGEGNQSNDGFPRPQHPFKRRCSRASLFRARSCTGWLAISICRSTVTCPVICVCTVSHDSGPASQERSLEAAGNGGIRRCGEHDLLAREMDSQFARGHFHPRSPDGLSRPEFGWIKYECSWERERLAFAAQERCLRLHGTNLWKTFEIDRAIFLLSAEFVC